ncbi:terminase gpP N-terminus-related DNA-binding protein [Pseudonocardia sediminis]|uniref:terminase gpP N-terminus-related DNA-binding protein n=1 Tax=Pseudonocardia sediminis TaxID=1397368 RepID=UPI00102A1172|nr:hypothetical protein [Pseudonocardia sediminis]
MTGRKYEVTHALVRLMTGEIEVGDMTEAELADSFRALSERKAIEGRTAAELYRRGWTWPRIAALRKVDQSTVHRWAQPYLRDGET